MLFNDLREFIKKAEEIGESQLIEGADCDPDIGALTELLQDEPEPKLLLFDRIKGYPPGEIESEPSGARTLHHLIKSQVLCQLS